jgi:predicted ATP-dependent serine protease
MEFLESKRARRIRLKNNFKYNFGSTAELNPLEMCENV